MTSETEAPGERRWPCPDYQMGTECDMAFDTRDALRAHLEWDHNRSEFKANQMIDREVTTDDE